MEILSKLAERLGELLNEAEINAAKLSQEIYLEQSAISKFLHAQRMPSIQSLVLIADYFNVTADYLLGLSDVLDDRKFKQRPPFCEQLDFLLANFHRTKYRVEKDAHFTGETLRRWQKGIYEPTVESLVRLAKYFGCSVDFVLGREI